MEDKATFRKIKKVLDFVWDNPHSSFYRDKYKKVGINISKDIKTIEDFKKLPYLTKEEIIKSDPFSRAFLTLSKISTIGISSGTTRGLDALSIVFKSRLSKTSNKNISKRNKLKNRKMMYLLPPVRAVMTTFSSFANLKLEGMNIAGDVSNLALSAKIAEKLKINALRTTPTILYFFTPFLKKEYDLSKIKLLSLGMEYCTREKALFLKKNYSRAKIIYRYGASEVDGFIGIDCNFLNPLFSKYFHLNPELHYELIDSNGLEELVITDLINNMFPLIRYKTGDVVKIDAFSCKCGETNRIKVLGRVNFDVFKIQGAFIYKDLVEQALLPFREYILEEWQLHIYEFAKEGKIIPKLKLQIILKLKFSSKRRKQILDSLEKGISKGLYLSPRKTLEDLVKEKLFMPLEVESVDSFPKTVKFQYLVSHLI